MQVCITPSMPAPLLDLHSLSISTQVVDSVPMSTQMIDAVPVSTQQVVGTVPMSTQMIDAVPMSTQMMMDSVQPMSIQVEDIVSMPTQVEDTVSMSMQDVDIHFLSMPIQVEDTSSILTQAVDFPSMAIQMDLHFVSEPTSTSELNLHTLDLSSVPVHSVPTPPVIPARQNPHTRSVTPIYFEIEGELAEKKLRAISNYSNVISRSCDHNGGIITSKDADLKLTIPKGAIENGVSVKIFIATSLFDPFIPHRNGLASPYYYIVVSKSYCFYKPVQVEFQHFAVVTACDPSHFQLSSCEDDDESFTMRPVDYALTFSIQDGIFQTDRFCSYCLSQSCSDPMITKIGAFFLKPSEFG